MNHRIQFCRDRTRWWWRRWPRELRYGLGLQKAPGKPGNWWWEKAMQLLELLGVFCLYEMVLVLIKPSTRPLRREEVQLVNRLFGAGFPAHLVRIDERAWIGSRSHGVAYVSFFTINAWGAMSTELLVHELVHVWQYVEMGPVYIPRALRAQRSRMGYNYGGLNALLDSVREKTHFRYFNLEQQAEIVTDWFRLRHGLAPQYGDAGWQDHWVYEAVLRGEGLLAGMES